MHVATFSIKTGSSFSPASLATLDSEETLVLLFGAPDLIDTPHRIREVVDACPRSHVMGCSTAGEIHGCEISDDSMAVAAVRFDNTPIRTAHAAVHSPNDSYAAGRAIAAQLRQPSLRGVLVLSDGLNVNGSELVAGINSVTPPHVVVTEKDAVKLRPEQFAAGPASTPR